MSTPDILVFIIYLIGTIAVAMTFMSRNNSLSEMFGAGGRVPWWVSGLSTFMTLFSAGSFVVWGGLAYSQGMVAMTVLVVIGISGIITAQWVAPRYKKLGVTSPAEFVFDRFGYGVTQYITWALLGVRVISAAIALYALAAVLDPLLFVGSEASFARSAALISVLGVIVVGYTMIGGLWAVLLTDVLQFIILSVAVIFIVVLAFTQLGGVSELRQIDAVQYFQPLNADFTAIVIVGWIITHVFVLGADWAFVQRHVAVPKPDDARKSMMLFSVLYIVSPFIWLAPAMFYRLIDANANPEQAYILISAELLPIGMLGLMAAAMFSATASMISSQINVFAGTLTTKFFSDDAHSAAKQVWFGRLMTVIIGAIIVCFALSVPFLGGAQSVVFALMSLLISPIFAPVLWGLFSKSIGSGTVWAIAVLAGFAGLVVKFGDLFVPALLGDSGVQIIEWIAANKRFAEMLAGVVVPLTILIAVEVYTRMNSREHPQAVSFFTKHPNEKNDYTASDQVLDADSAASIRIVVAGLAVCGIISLALILVNLDSPSGLAICGFILLASAWILKSRTKIFENA